MAVIVKSKELAKHTMTLTSNLNRYPKKYRYSLVPRIQDKALDITEMLREANDLPLTDPVDRAERFRYQSKALTYCKELLDLIELSFELHLIDGGSLQYWTGLALDVKNMASAWLKKDKQRAASLEK